MNKLDLTKANRKKPFLDKFLLIGFLMLKECSWMLQCSLFYCPQTFSGVHYNYLVSSGLMNILQNMRETDLMSVMF